MSLHRRITVDFDPALLAEVDRAAASLDTSRNRFIAGAVERALHQDANSRIDAAFARMEEDPAYRKSLDAVESAMAGASDEAWRSIDAPPAARSRARGRRRASR